MYYANKHWTYIYEECKNSNSLRLFLGLLHSLVLLQTDDVHLGKTIHKHVTVYTNM